MSYEEMIGEERWKLRRFFTRKELKSKLARNAITRASLISRYHDLHFQERYPFGVPPHLIQPKTIVAIIKNSK